MLKTYQFWSTLTKIILLIVFKSFLIFTVNCLGAQTPTPPSLCKLVKDDLVGDRSDDYCTDKIREYQYIFHLFKFRQQLGMKFHEDFSKMRQLLMFIIEASTIHLPKHGRLQFSPTPTIVFSMLFYYPNLMDLGFSQCHHIFEE